MDVVCGRCRAEYEFDDALISERGTTVRCTNCGLQFKVFPPVGKRAPEVWRVFDPGDSVLPPVEYDSLATLQKAIATGDVTAAHLFARGEEPPRPFAEIVELQPLLRQPISDHPPPQDPERATHDHAGSETVLGIQTRPDPAMNVAASPRRVEDQGVAPDEKGGRADERESEAKGFEEASVPSQPADDVEEKRSSPERDVDTGSRTPSPVRPRVRSALSVEPSAPSSSGSTSRPPSSSPRSPRNTSLAPRSSLRSTISGSLPPVEPPVPEPEAKTSLPPVEPKVTRAWEAKSEGGEITAKDDGGQLTPTPTGLRAYGSVDSEPASAVPARPAKRRARGGWVVFCVLVGGVALAFYSSRDRVAAGLGDASTSDVVTETEASTQQLKEIEREEVAWLKRTLFAQDTRGPLSVSEASEIEESEALSSWALVNFKRSRDDLKGARKAAGAVEEKAGSAYALALLDLAESPSSPPWPSILERLKEASVGERGAYLARSSYIWALAESGNVARARADFDSFARLSGASEAPLFDRLQAYLDTKSETVLAGNPEDALPREAGASSAEPKAPVQVVKPAEQESERPDAGEISGVSDDPEASKEKPEPVQEKPRPAVKSEVSEAIRSKVNQADGLWRTGDKDGAVVLYRQVVAEIGTTHFLGQRSASRIRLVDREKAEDQ